MHLHSGCNEIESQAHIITNCNYLKSKLQTNQNETYMGIYGNPTEQKRSISVFNKIEQSKLNLKKHILPGGRCGQDLCKFDVLH